EVSISPLFRWPNSVNHFRGRTGGRPQGLTDAAKRKAIAAEALYTRGELSVNAIAENLGISKVTLYRYLKYRGVQVGRKG
ncbi:helix-turn-helix domain-containing protein, partial [Enterobacter bugandensis]